MDNINRALTAVKKELGPESIMLLNGSTIASTSLISTGFMSLDSVLGGGIPKGRQVEIFGVESSGKSSICMQIAANVCTLGGCVAYIDMENSIHIPYLTDLGIDENRFAISQPNTGTEALKIAEYCIKENVDLVVIDSISALITAAEVESDYGDANMGALSRLMSMSCKKLNPVLSNSSSVLLWVNQVRSRIGGYGTGMVTTGGNALKFYSAQRIELSYIGLLKEGEETIGSKIKFKVVKNKLSAPYKSTELSLYFGSGFCKYSDLLDLATAKEIVKRSGSWFSYGDIKLGQGRENVRELLRSDEKLFNSIVTKIGEIDGS